MDLREPCAIFLTEHVGELNEGAGFLNRLDSDVRLAVQKRGTMHQFDRGESVFTQGQAHSGIWVVERGRIRTFYTGPTGREVTLAYWTPGHFVGGPELFGDSLHIWSADALETSRLLFLSGRSIRALVEEHPTVALSVIDGLVAKGKCYSALIQMFGTRSATERLHHLLNILAAQQGREVDGKIVIDRNITYEQLATMVGATRQWVSSTLESLQSRGVMTITRQQITIDQMDSLRDMLDMPNEF